MAQADDIEWYAIYKSPGDEIGTGRLYLIVCQL